MYTLTDRLSYSSVNRKQIFDWSTLNEQGNTTNSQELIHHISVEGKHNTTHMYTHTNSDLLGRMLPVIVVPVKYIKQ